MLTLALGVGSTTAIFSVVEAVLLRPLPYPDADRLAMVWENVNLTSYKNVQNALAASVRSVVRSIDSALPITRIRMMNDVRSAATASQQFNLLLVGVFAILALTLAAVGVYGVTAYAVAQRTRELGIRVALGANRGELLRLVIAHGARLTIAGVALGTIVALGLTGIMASLLFDVGAHDPITFVGVGALLMIYPSSRRSSRRIAPRASIR